MSRDLPVVPTAQVASVERRSLLLTGVAVASFALAIALWLAGPWLLELADRGNVLRTNDFSGITRDTSSTLLGRIEFAALAVAALCGQAALGPSTPAHGRLGRWLRAPAVWAMGLTVLVALVLLEARGTFVGDKLVFQLEDDAMISMRYARNLVNGAGLVYNAGERVEGYTDFLWVIVMALVHLVAPERLTSAVVLVLNAAIAGVAIVLVQRTLRRANVAVPLVVLACLALAVDANMVMWVASGLETIAMALCVTACAWVLLEPDEGAGATVGARDRSAVFLASLAAIPLLRSDGALLALMLGATFLATRANKLRAVLLLAAAAAPTFAHFAFRLAYYGHPFPNTYYLKMIDRPDRLILGLGGYGFRFATAYLVLVPLVAYVAVSRQFAERARLLAGIVFAQVAYSIYVGGDTFWYLRFITPVIPLAFLLGALGLDRLLVGAVPRRATLVAGTVLTMLPFQAFDGRLGEVAPRHTLLRDALATAHTLRANLPAGASVTVYSAGMVPYFAPELRFIDVLGKAEEHIGHQTTYVGKVIGHNKFDFAWIYGTRKPDVAYTEFTCRDIDEFEGFPEEERQRRIHATAPEVFVAPLYELDEPHFRDDYFPGEVTIGTGQRTTPLPGCFFVRKDSPLPQHWAYAE